MAIDMPGWLLSPSQVGSNIFLITFVVRTLNFVLLNGLGVLSAFNFLPIFDSSPSLLATPELTNAISRWDALHYASIAAEGYRWEQQLAWPPGWPVIMRLVAALLYRRRGGSTVQNTGGVGSGQSLIFGALANQELYSLTAQLYGSSFAVLTSLIYLVAPCPAVLSSGYSESIFAYFAFAGYRRALKREWLSASLFLAAATSTRATGVFNALALGVMVLQGGEARICGSRSLQRLPRAVAYSTIVILPFVLFQLYTYISFCSSPAPRPWCKNVLPFSYSFVQAHYWNIGLLKYWELAQLGNWILASPILSVSLYAAWQYTKSKRPAARLLPLSDSRILGIHLHHMVITFLLVFASHVQIALRVAITNPVVWWTVTELAFDWEAKPSRGKRETGDQRLGRLTRTGTRWIRWSVIWGAVSLVLWSGFYPPA